MTKPILPDPPTLPKELLTLIGEYGMARTDGVNDLEIQHRWLTMIEGIKIYASDYALSARLLPEGWKPIETAPEPKGDFFFCHLAWGPDDDKSTGDGFRWNGRWFAAGVFHRIGQERRFEIREIEVRPTHWMPLPAAPTEVQAEPRQEG